MIYLVRHGETDYNVEKISQGWRQIPINKKGVEQAETVAITLEKRSYDYFYCSDLLRAQMTADIINKKLNMPIVYDDRLRERSSGILEDNKKHELPIELVDDFNSNPHKFLAESWEDVYNRVRSFINFIIAKKFDNALVITHGGVIVTVLYCIQNSKYNEDKFMMLLNSKNVENTEIVEIDFEKKFCNDKYYM